MFLLGISEGSCINPFQEVGGPRLFSPKNSKIPRLTPHPPIKNVPSLKQKKRYVIIQGWTLYLKIN